MTDLERAAERIASARAYTLRLLDSLDPAEWFRVPAAGVSHVGWQVGHLAYAEYRMALLRTRGRQPGDGELLPDDFQQLFGIQSSPEPDPSRYPTPASIRATLDRIHARVLVEVPGLDPAALDGPLDPPHTIAKTKTECLYWCAAHEMLHAGQIGLLRRQLGHKPLW